jgi:hypothetical protein
MKAVWIEWLDSVGMEGWTEETRLDPIKIVSVGILVKETKTTITLAISKGNQKPPQYDSLLSIPKFAIQTRRRLEPI